MLITLTDIEVIIKLYEECFAEYEREMTEWYMDEDNTGIPFERTKGDVIYEVYCKFCEYKRNK